MALINTFSWKYCQLDVVVRRCSDSVSDHLGHVKVDICDLSRCTWKRSNGTACTVAYPPHLHGPVRISGNFVPDHFHPCFILWDQICMEVCNTSFIDCQVATQWSVLDNT